MRPTEPGRSEKSQTRSKNDTYWRILNSAVTLDVRHGHRRWTMTQLAKSSGVSRALVYHYFGKSKLDILRSAISFFGSDLSGAEPWRMASWEKQKLAVTFHDTREIVANAPAVLPFYFLHRGLDTAIGREIRHKERLFRSKVAHFFPHWSPVDLDAAFALFFGVAFAPDVSNEGVERAIERFLRDERS